MISYFLDVGLNVEQSEQNFLQTTGRRLTTLLAVDICNYTGKIEANEQDAIRLTDIVHSILADVVTENDGRIFKTMGDGFLVEFSSAKLGVNATMDFFQKLKAGRSYHPELNTRLVRAGLHVGDVTIRSDGDLLGHGVNIVSRLQDMAMPGTVLASSNIINLVGQDLDIKMRKRDGLKLKNISERMTAYELSPGRKRFPLLISFLRAFRKFRVTPVIILLSLLFSTFLAFQIYKLQQPGGWQAKASEIVVFGFENQTDRTELDYLAEGMADILTNALFQVEGLAVKRETDSTAKAGPETLSFRGRFLDNVSGYLLIAQVSNDIDGTLAWSKSFEFETLGDLSRLQSRLATDIADAMGVVTSEADRDRMVLVGTENIDAFIAFQKGRSLLKFWHQDRNDPDMVTAFEHIKRASELDPVWSEPRIHIVDIYHHFITGDVANLPERNSDGNPIDKLDAQKIIERNLQKASEDAETEMVSNKALMNAYFFSDNWRNLKTPSVKYVEDATEIRGELEWLFEPIIILVLGEYDLSTRLSDDRILKYDPKNGTGHAYAIRSLLLQGRLAAATKRLENARSLTFSNRLDEVEGFILFNQGDAEALTTHIATAGKLSEMHQDYFSALAIGLSGDTETALVKVRNSKNLQDNQVYQAFAINHLGAMDEARLLFESIAQKPLGDQDIATAMAYGAACGLKDFQVPLSLDQKLKDARAELPPCVQD